MNSLRTALKAVCFALLLGQASAECKSLPAEQEIGKTSWITIESEGVNRSFLVTIPALYSCEKPSPVILSYHGESRDATQQLQLSQMSNPFFNDFAIVVYPQAAEVHTSPPS
jgi:poly(3-hydroxybutyrate) depolymerase